MGKSIGRWVLGAVAATLATAALAGPAVGVQGFRGVAWGEGASRLDQGYLVSQQGDVRCYVRFGEEMRFGKVPVTQVRYCFQRDRFFGALIDTEATAAELVQVLSQIYGDPSGGAAQRSAWGDEHSTARLQIEAPSGNAPARLIVFSNRFGPGVADW